MYFREHFSSLLSNNKSRIETSRMQEIDFFTIAGRTIKPQGTLNRSTNNNNHIYSDNRIC